MHLLAGLASDWSGSRPSKRCPPRWRSAPRRNSLPPPAATDTDQRQCTATTTDPDTGPGYPQATRAHPPGRAVQWASNVVDNEGLGRKSSKGMYASMGGVIAASSWRQPCMVAKTCLLVFPPLLVCCIYHRSRGVDESSDESSSSSDSDSSNSGSGGLDSEFQAAAPRSRRQQARRRRERQEEGRRQACP